MEYRLAERPGGPKSADETLRARVDQALCATGHIRLRHLSVRVRDGHAVLEGRVPSWYSKQLAQTAALSVPGIHSLSNELNVCRKPFAIPMEVEAR